ncbi:hypothetical protein X768_13950 [Mesorhizobium sp. LSJC265A00]|nr:hypothetical protein X768_13950 [Mesorhizobium sp. LSJC265A00]
MLFCSVDWHSVTEIQRQRVAREIAAIDGDRLLNTSTDSLTDYIVEKFQINALTLIEAAISIDQQEVDIDVSQDWNRDIRDRSRSFMVEGTSYEVEVPFKGDASLFNVQPTTFNMNPPTGKVRGHSLFFSISGTNLDASGVRTSIERTLSSVKSSLSVIAKDAAGFNSSLRGLATEQIEQRKKKLLNDRNIVSEIGFPMKRRDGVATTFVAPEVRRNIAPTLPPALSAVFKPEPVLSGEEYESIMKIMEGMVQVMEYSPSAFAHMGEENLRTHFLVQLNGQYQGQATGETFNYEGKTDILIKSSGKNIFIAECKFWRGEKGYLETIDQLLGYLSWRDTKAAILLFNRNKDFTNVCNLAREATLKHPKCKRQTKTRSESSWQFLFSHRDDPNREMLITVSAFNIPSEDALTAAPDPGTS